ncbi:MAG: hypothetical protein NUK65_10030, partial [Firmicutes bacterium]|nr:hypothetical protein [Bacillota bacterium]
MRKIEKSYLVGLFFIMTGVFLPWFRLMEYQSSAPAIRLVAVATISGHTLLFGWIIFIVALAMVSVFFLEPPFKNEIRILAAHRFSLAFILVLLVIGGIIPPLTEHLVNPHIGLLVVFIGWILT